MSCPSYPPWYDQETINYEAPRYVVLSILLSLPPSFVRNTLLSDNIVLCFPVSTKYQVSHLYARKMRENILGLFEAFIFGNQM
jgi:hypothetical protein